MLERDLGSSMDSERDLAVVDVREGPRVKCEHGQRLRLSSWIPNEPTGMLSLLSACDTPDTVGHMSRY